MRGHIVLSLVATLALTPRVAGAQDLAPGQRIRVHASGLAGHPVIGTVARYDSTTLWVQRDSALDSIPLNAIRALERSSGSERTPVASGLDDIVWLAGITAITYEASQGSGCNSTAKHIGCGILGFLFGGYVWSEAIDHLWPTHSVETWVKVPVRSVSLRPVFSHGVGLALVLSL